MTEPDYKQMYLLLTSQYCRDTEALQAKIDALMLEYCPDDMTPEQIDEWEERQRPTGV